MHHEMSVLGEYLREMEQIYASKAKNHHSSASASNKADSSVGSTAAAYEVCTWTNDSVYKYNMENLKKCSERVSHSCTKLSIIVLNSDCTSIAGKQMISEFLAEFMPYVQTYYDFYK
jgi:hypothetical protein